MREPGPYPEDAGRIAPRSRGGRPPSKRGRVREQEILDAAVRIFNDKGYAAASIQDIADAVGLLKGSLYYYVPSKEDLLYRIVTEVHREATANLEAAQATPGDEVAKLRALVTGHLLNFGANLAMVRVFYVDFTHLSSDRHEEILIRRRAYEEFMTNLIVSGQRKGLFARDVNARLAVIGILTMLNSIYVWYQPQGPLPIEMVAKEYEKMVLRSLGADVPASLKPTLARRQTKSRSTQRAGQPPFES